jgi:hypothetical protein
MKRVLLGLLVLVGASAQTKRPPEATIADLLISASDPSASDDGWSAKLAEQIRRAAPKATIPNDAAASFSRSLIAAVTGRQIVRAQAEELARLVLDAARGVRSNRATAERVRAILAKLGVEEMRQNQVTQRLIVLGEASRGPDDTPVLPRKLDYRPKLD